MKNTKVTIIPEHIVPEQTFIQHLANTCDMCGKVIVTKMYEELEIVVSYKYGDNYPEGGSGDTKSVDLCPECFKNELIPFLESKNCKIQTEKWSW